MASLNPIKERSLLVFRAGICLKANTQVYRFRIPEEEIHESMKRIIGRNPREKVFDPVTLHRPPFLSFSTGKKTNGRS
jgi:hypothetical protein